MLLKLSSSITDKDEAKKKLEKAEKEKAEERHYQRELASLAACVAGCDVDSPIMVLSL